MRNILGRVGKTHRAAVAALVKTVFVQETREAARQQWRSVADNLRERLNKEIKRRTNVVGIFPNGKGVKRSVQWIDRSPDAIIRIVGAMLLEQNDEWALTRRYMSLECLARIVDNPVLSLPGVGN
jgi:putative transposase